MQIKADIAAEVHFVAMQQKPTTALTVVAPSETPAGPPETLRSCCGNCHFEDLTGATGSPEGILAPLCRIAAEQVFAEDENVARLGDPRDRLVVLQEGILRLSRNQADGRRHISSFLFPGDVVAFGEDEAVWSADVEAVTMARLCVLEPRRVRGLSDRPDRLYRRLFQAARRQAERAERHAALMAMPSPIARLAGFLLELERRGREVPPTCSVAEARPAGVVTIRIAMRRADIADYLSLTIETVSRSFRRMVEGDLIRLPHPKRVLVPDRSRLEQLVGETAPRVAALA